MSAPELIVESTVRFLRDYAPFSGLVVEDLRFFAERARLGYFPAGTTIVPAAADVAVDPAVDSRIDDAVDSMVDAKAGVGASLYVVRQGHVRSEDPTFPGSGVVLGPGECFPLVRLAAGTAGFGTFTAAEDVFCWQLGREDFDELRRRSAPFAEFCARALATIVRQSIARLRHDFGSRAIEQQTLVRSLDSLVRRPPVSCRAATPLGEALRTMRSERVGTLVVVDDDERPVGIFTLRDLRDRVVLEDVPLDRPIEAVMTPRVVTLDALSTAQDAIAAIATHGWHQVLVTRGGRLAGVVSEGDLFALQRVSMRNVLTSIEHADGVESLRAAAADVAALTDNLVAQGAGAGTLTQAIAALNDSIARRVFALLAPRHALEGIDWCWLALGSEGRREQTAASDQDNAIVFAARPGDAEAVRLRLLPFARDVNEALASLGMPLCRGNVMARNPDCCLALDEWTLRFSRWIREPTPQALLGANVYFDFRPLAGAASLAERLRAQVLGLTADNGLFLRLLTVNALQAEPPLGVIRSFRTEEGTRAGTIDLKAHGTRLFVDAARAFALGLGFEETNTVQRLRLAGRRLNFDPREIEAYVEAFEFLQLLRLRVQRDAPAAAGRLDPDRLNEIDRRLLKEAFRQARTLQQRLERTWGR
jgi:CBS domain-containing protein